MEEKEGTHREKQMVWLAHLLVVGALIALAIDACNLRRVDVMRARYQEHDIIDVPEALYFDGMVASVRIPALLICFGFQLTSPFIFSFNMRAVRNTHRFVFWTLWLAVWLYIIM